MGQKIKIHVLKEIEIKYNTHVDNITTLHTLEVLVLKLQYLNRHISHYCLNTLGLDTIL